MHICSDDFVIVDCELPGPNSTHRYEVPAIGTGKVLVYCYQGEGTVGGTAMRPKQTAYMSSVPAIAAESDAGDSKMPVATSGVGVDMAAVGAALDMVSTSTTVTVLPQASQLLASVLRPTTLTYLILLGFWRLDLCWVAD